jgi:predicted HTH domain antitoxin
MTVQTLKRRFLTYELGLLSLKAALSTRDQGWPIYDLSSKLHQRSKAKRAFRAVLEDVETNYLQRGATEQAHNRRIVDVADYLSAELKHDLYQERFRIGISQKLVNVHLKYLWAAGMYPEPPHCPIDGIIRDAAGIEYEWTRSDSISEYKQAIVSLRKVANGKSLSVWELEEFRRRGDRVTSMRALLPTGGQPGASSTAARARRRRNVG